RIDPSKLLPTDIINNHIKDKDEFINQKEEYDRSDISLVDSNNSNINFTEINRYMKIYLLKEDLENYELENGILSIKSKNLLFELALCGDFKDPKWKLIKVRTTVKDKKINEVIMGR